MELNFSHEVDTYDQSRYKQSFTECAKAIIVDPNSSVEINPGETPSDRPVVPAEFVRKLQPEDVVALAGEGRVFSADVSYVTPRKSLDEEGLTETSAVVLTVESYHDGVAQKQMYFIDRHEDLELNLDWYNGNVLTELVLGGERVSFSGIEPAGDTSALSDEEYADLMARHIADRKMEQRLMTDDERDKFLAILDHYVATRAPLE